MNSKYKKKLKEGEDQTSSFASQHNFPVVGVGASAGGLNAFKILLKAIPNDSGMAYVLVQHLNPKHQSNLTQILSRISKVPVKEITEDVKLFPNHIYVMPSDKILTTADGVLKLSPREDVKTNLVIDIFFSSLAVVWDSMAVGIVLSGTGADGTLGLKTIKEYGGISIAQDESAAYTDMPISAINAGVVDFILSPEKMPAQLKQISNTFAIVHADGKEELISKDDEFAFKQMLQVLRQRTNVDFAYYKQSTVRRRIGRRMALHKKEKLTDYLKFLRLDKSEQDALFHDILIPVSSFFRDEKTFEKLNEKVFPIIEKNKLSDNPIRFWIAGCSTGEEAYSIAICFHEFFGEKYRKDFQIFASDISDRAIKKARAGIFSKADLQNVSEERLKNYFTKTDGSYKVKKFIRDMCVFAHHNFLNDPPFAKIDLITCRNVLIYMDTFLQKKALTTFHYALKENGILLLGKSETVSATPELFTSFDKHDKIYIRKHGAGKFKYVTLERREELLASKNNLSQIKQTQLIDFRKSADAILISKSPAGVIVNEQMDIVHIHGDITAFLQTSPGKPSFNLLKMAMEGLAFELRNTLHKVKNINQSVIKEEIPLQTGIHEYFVTIEIFPLTDIIDPHYLILFTKISRPSKNEILEPTSEGNGKLLKRISLLENELVRTREDMRSITEDMETANEELQSANEELQSSNEEMQSINEELETSKEELQSSNDELTILNQELIDKQEQLNASRQYSEGIVTTIREPLLVLDKNLRIKTANESFYKKFKLTEQDTEGKLFYELQNHQWNNNELRTLLEKILPQKNRMDDFEMTVDERTMLFNASQIINEINTEPLILLAIEDVTDSRLAKKLKESEEAQATILAHLKLATDSANVGTWSLDIKTKKLEWNDLHKKMWGYDKHHDSLDYQDWHKIIIEDDKEKALNTVEQAKINHTFYEVEYRIKKANDNTIRWIKSVGQYQYNQAKQAIMLTGISIDITDQKEIEKRLTQSEAKFRNLILQAPVLITTFEGSSFIVETINNTGLEIWGKTYEKVINKPLFESLPELEEGLKNILTDVLTTGKPFISHEIELQLKRKGKPDTAFFNLIYQPIHDLENKICGIILIGTEITHEVNFRKQIEASEMRFIKMVQQSPFAFAILKGKDMVISLANDAIKQIWGKGKKVEGKQLFDVLPELKESVFPKLFDDVYTTGIPHLENEIIAKIMHNGILQEMYFNLVYQPFYESDDTILGVTIIAVEVTQQVIAKKQIEDSEKQFRIFADSIQNLAWIANGDGWIYWYNQRWFDYTGTSLDEMKGWGWQKVHHPDYVEAIVELSKKLWKKDEPFELTFPLRRHDGEYRWFLTRAYPVKGTNGNIERWIGTNTDINEQKTKEQQKDEFISIASHEMKTPLTAAKAYLQLLEMNLEKGRDEVNVYAKKANVAVERLNKLVDELLDVSKIQAGKIVYNFAPFNFNELIDNTVEDIQHSSPKHSIIKNGKAERLLTGDKDRLQQVIINLLSNALKYSPNADEVYINVKENQNELQVSIKDLGIGMNNYHLEKIFDRYYRVEENALHFKGLGIGLYISNEIIQRHNGKMWVESEKGKGSTFYFSLPLL